MDKPDYAFIDDASRGILKIVIRNHWDLTTTEAFRADVDLWWSKIMRDRARHQRRCLLIDASEHGVQSQDVIRELSSAAKTKERIFRRTAIIVSGAIHQMQARRVRSSSSDHRICASEEEALAWLLRDDATSAVASWEGQAPAIAGRSARISGAMASVDRHKDIVALDCDRIGRRRFGLHP